MTKWEYASCGMPVVKWPDLDREHEIYMNDALNTYAEDGYELVMTTPTKSVIWLFFRRPLPEPLTRAPMTGLE